MLTNRKICFLQATTTPYRTELFNLLEKESLNKNIDIEVLYYKAMMGGRSWAVDREQMKHKYKIYNCFEFFIKSYPLFFSKKIIMDLIKNPNSEVVLGVSWNDFIVLLIIILKKVGVVKNKTHFWTEANFMDTGLIGNNLIKRFIRNKVFNSIDGYLIVPGEISKKTLIDHWGVRKKIVYLPNLVNIDYSQVQTIKLSQNKKNVLIVARLTEKIKGIKNFLESINQDEMKECEFFIAGDGDDRQSYENYIKLNNLHNIHLLGNLDREQVLSYYKSCDIFVLPSYSDSNPLSVIEALFAGKPLLISDQCGNKYEAIREGVNGFTMDPFNPEDISNKFKQLAHSANLSDMGKESLKIATQLFQPSKITKYFLENI
jgi:glycosyltransferase involved in cell wall biosynthesis